MSTDSGTQRSGTGELRSDLEPLTSRFELLAPAESATWLSGTLGDESVPGPSTYWIDAIITLPEAEIARIGDDYQAAATPSSPTVEPALGAQLPAGPYLASAALDAAFSQGEYRSTVHLGADGRTLILRSVFQ